MKIILTHLTPEHHQYKVAKALKEKGVKTVSISIKSFNQKLFENSFDEIICLDLKSLKPKTIFSKFVKNPSHFFKFFYKILTIKADAVICQGAPHYLTSFFIWLFKGRFLRIYFPYDFNFSRYKQPIKGIPRRELWGEKYSFNNCDAIIHKSAKEELDLLPKSFNVKNKPSLKFLCYPSSDFFNPFQPKKKISYINKGIHVVYVGSFLHDTFYYVPMNLDYTKILKQKIHLHIYGKELDKEHIPKITLNDPDLEPYLHIHPLVPMEKISEEISKYDFGLSFYNFTKYARPEAIKFTSGNKLSSYLEGGIPIVTNKKNSFYEKTVRKNYLGPIIEDAKDLKEHIKKFNYSKGINNILKFREKHSVDKHVGELIEFVRSLKNKNLKQ